MVMKLHTLLHAALLGTTGLAAAHLLAPSEARAQSNTTGAIQGVVTDKKTGDAMPGVTVVATSPALSQTQTAITDEKGFYKISDLPPGDYLVTFYYADLSVEQSGVHVGVNKASSVFQKIDQGAAGGETIHVTAKAPTIDPTSTTQGITIDKNYLENIPIPGRTFEAALGAAAGSQGDDMGVAFSGSTSLENQYYVDGVNTTGLTYGTVGSPVVNDFIEEIEVITGGYNAEMGRATGGIVNVVTKSGSNEFKGSVWGYWQPGVLTYAAQTTPVNAASIDAVSNLNYDADVGFEVGGPIIKDKLWYFVGVDPRFVAYDVTRTTKTQMDCRVTSGSIVPGIFDAAHGFPNGAPSSSDYPGLSTCNNDYTKAAGKNTPDIDPRTGFYITEPLSEENRTSTGRTYNLLGKINYAATPEHQGQLSVEALPSSGRQDGVYGPAINGGQYSDLVTDVSAKWTSKFNDNKTEVEAVVGWHREYVSTDPLDSTLFGEPLQVLENGDLYNWGKGAFPGVAPTGAETMTTQQGCFGAAEGNKNALFPSLGSAPCPMDTRVYVTGGVGTIQRDTEQREAARVSVTQRVKAAGNHEIKAGIDGENNTSDKARLYSGGEFITNIVNNQEIVVDRWVKLGGDQSLGQPIDPKTGQPDPFYDKICTTAASAVTGGTSAAPSFYCAYLSGQPGSRGTQVQSNTFNWAAYLRDSWQIMPNLTLNAGIRYEDQSLRYASFLQNTVDPLTHVKLGDSAMHLSGNWAPRIGLLYDWTKEGRSKIYGHWGRFFESIPMDINERSFGGETTDEQIWLANGANCGPKDDNIGGPNGKNCGAAGKPYRESLIGASGELIEPGIQAEYMDEWLAGAEYEILDDLKLGVSFQHRAFGRIIEDVSIDGAQTYIIANPHEFSTDEEHKLQSEIDAADPCIPKNMQPAGYVCQKAILQNELTQYKGIRTFDTGRRDYNALQFTMTRRFSKQLYVQASYTYSRTEGNYPGSYSADNGQVDPNISSQFDLIELLANRIGPLPQDRPHYIKLDGYYTFDLKKKGNLTVGVRLRALSGVPINALGSHYLYGNNESFLLPRGEIGRSDFEHGLDMHIGYRRSLSKNMALEFFADLYNVYDRQGTYSVDNTYAEGFKLSSPTMAGVLQNANPVSGGTYSDLIWVKRIDENGAETHEPIGRNPNYRNTSARYAPGYARLGFRLTF
jgi:outer membrane receptor protein involved in Fe transport